MELKNSVKHAIHFIFSAQEYCEKHTKCIEHSWMQEYNSYINDWKQSQIEQKRQLEKKEAEKKEVKGVDLELFEELALADSLLKKARSIRKKNEKTPNGIIDNIGRPTSNDVAIVMPSDTSVKLKNKKQLSQSKSDYILTRSRKTVVPRSKSASGTLVPKEEKKSSNKNKNYSSLSAKCHAINHVKSPDKLVEELAVISSKDLNMLKKVQVSLSTHRESTHLNSSCSDATENSPQHQLLSQPSSREFFTVMKGKLNAASTDFRLQIWYPFLSSKSEARLTSVKCSSFSSMKKTYATLCAIQETMMLLDLLYLIESEIYPNIVFDLKDTNKLRLCSYLQSIFNPKGQRIPMLDPNR